MAAFGSLLACLAVLNTRYEHLPDQGGPDQRLEIVTNDSVANLPHVAAKVSNASVDDLPPRLVLMASNDLGDASTASWPEFKSSADLAASPWGKYFNDLYGSLPPQKTTWGYPCLIGRFWSLHNPTLSAHKVHTPKAAECPKQALDHYQTNNRYQPKELSWIWHPYPYLAYKDVWMEVLHQRDPFHDEQVGMWFLYAAGSGIWFYVGNSIAFDEHATAYTYFGASSNTDLAAKAAARGYDSIQFVAHVDHVNYPCDSEHTGRPGFTYMNREIVATRLSGKFSCGTKAGAPKTIRRGWADKECACDNSRGHLNCKGVPGLSDDLDLELEDRPVAG